MARVIRVLKAVVSTTEPRILLKGYSTSVNEQTFEVNIGGRLMKFCSGKYAKLADGAVVAQVNNTNIMVTAVSEKNMASEASGIPLFVDYRERASAAGRIPYNFFRRELRPLEREILTSRLIDRSLRPLFPKGYSYKTQIICSLLSADGKEDNEVLSINGACAALMLSDIPWNGPVAAVRVVLTSSREFLVNPTKKEARNSKLNIVLACTKDKIIMVEGQGSEFSEEQFCQAVQVGMTETQKLLDQLLELRMKKVRDVELSLPSEELMNTVDDFCSEKILEIFSNSSHKKLSRDDELFALRDELIAHIKDKGMVTPSHMISQTFWNTAKKCMEVLVLDKGLRCDGRGVHELRPIECEVDLFEILHGSARFSRGETQVMSSVTLDSLEHAAKADKISLLLGAERSREFMIHYDFPPFANNVTGHFLSAGRREIGHGALAEKALKPLLPKEFPFTIRVASQVTDSNGSSSMATVCGSSLALFDAGIPMTKSAAGVACGLVLDSKSDSSDNPRYQILSDITGIEDALGCMDFKMAGTKDGVTSCQIDIKNCNGLSFEQFREAVFHSKTSRLKVLDIMDECQSLPRPSLKENGPVYEIINVPVFKRSKLIGQGGNRIRAITEETGAEIRTIEDEKMSIFATSRVVMEEVKERIEQLLNDIPPGEESLEVGAVYNSRIRDIKPFGFIIDLLPSNVNTLLHVSRLSHSFVHPNKMGVKIGDEIEVKYLGRDETGRLLVSHKALQEPPKITELQDGEVYKCKIVGKRSFGLMVILPDGSTQLLHARHIAHEIVDPMADFEVGAELEVKITGKDDRGRPILSRKELLEPSEKANEYEIGEIYKSHVVKIHHNGLMIRLGNGLKAFLHQSTINHKFIDIQNCKSGDEIEVKFLGRDESGQLRVSHKELELELGEVYEARIADVRRYGLIVVMPDGSTPLLHKLNIAHELIDPTKADFKIGDKIEVKYIGYEKYTGKKIISRKALLNPPQQPVNGQIRPQENYLKINKEYNCRIVDIQDRGHGIQVELLSDGTQLLVNAIRKNQLMFTPMKNSYKLGDEIKLKYLGVEKSTGKKVISHKAAVVNSVAAKADKRKNNALVKGNIYSALICDVRPFGYKIKLMPSGKMSFMHSSQIDRGYVDPMNHGYKAGDEISVKYLGINQQTGQIEVSRKALFSMEPTQSGSHLNQAGTKPSYQVTKKTCSQLNPKQKPSTGQAAAGSNQTMDVETNEKQQNGGSNGFLGGLVNSLKNIFNSQK